jgi:flagellar operon protein
VSGINTIHNKIAPNGVNSTLGTALGPGASVDNGFKQTLETQISGIDKAQSAIDQQLKAKADVKPMTLKFSNHAVERMSQRGMTFSPEQMTKIENAARKASEKGSKETLIFSDDSALIVSLKTNTIVTVMDKNALKENVFTNIDSTVMV